MAKKIGIIGLGKMGSNMSRRLKKKGYAVSGFDVAKETIRNLSKDGIKAFSDFEAFANSLENPCTIILSVPHASVDKAIDVIIPFLGKGSIIIDAGNSYYKDSVRRYEELKRRNVDFLDAGCSGGPSGALNGLSIMIGGDKDAFRKSELLFKDLSAKDGYGHFGPSGSGHFVKMVHNAIEYGIMQAMGEGFDLLDNGPYKLDLKKVCDVWQNGSVVRSYLIELAGRALSKDPSLKSVEGYVEDSGEGRWSIHAAMESDVPFTSISHSLFSRFRSRRAPFSDKLLAALRHEFGGHIIKKKK